jgi:4-aminobutyrate aminotransferase-like enzyme
MLHGIVFRAAAAAATVVERALAGGAIVLQSGPEGKVVTIAPPLSIEADQLEAALQIVEVAVGEAA